MGKVYQSEGCIARMTNVTDGKIEVKEHIVALRKSQGMSQSQFAESTGIPLKTLQKWEQGLRTPPDYVVRMLELLLKKNEAYTG